MDEFSPEQIKLDNMLQPRAYQILYIKYVSAQSRPPARSTPSSSPSAKPSTAGLSLCSSDDDDNADDDDGDDDDDDIHRRSMIPCQDSPSVKATYSAAMTAPSDLTVLMSGVMYNI